MPNHLADLLRQAADQFQERPALVGRSGLRDDVWSYRRLQRSAEIAAARLLGERGLKPGDRALVHGLNSPQLVAAYFGCFTAGVVVVPIDPHSTADFIERVADLTQAKLLISNIDSIDGRGLMKVSPDTLVAAQDARASVDCAVKGGDLAEIVFTSGTTGHPKGVMLTHRNIVSSVLAIEDIYPKQLSTRFLSLLPLSHMFEQTGGLFAPLRRGATVYYGHQVHSDVILRKVAAKRIDGIVAVPQMLDMLYRNVARRIENAGLSRRLELWQALAPRVPFVWRRRLAERLFRALTSAPDFFVCGGAALPPALEQNWESLGVRVIQGYGATECAPVISVNRFDRRVSGSVGWPVNCVDVELADTGEIWVRGDNVSPGYWQNDEATHAAFTADRRYRTGDLGEFGQHGELYIKGRSKDMIVLANGMNVFPEDIEPLLLQQAGVAAAVVIDLPDAMGKPVVTAVLSLPSVADESQRHDLAARVVRDVNTRLATHQRIGAVRLWTGDFPRTTLMKIQRWKVRAQLLDHAVSSDENAAETMSGRQAVTLEQLLASVCRVPLARISDTTDLQLDLGMDSLSRVELASLIEEQLGIICDDGELIGVRQVGDLKQLIGRGERSTNRVAFPAWPLLAWAIQVRRCLHDLLIVPLHAMLSTSFVVSGLEHLDDIDLPALFIANHSSHVDTLSVLRALPWRIRGRLCVAAAADYFFRNPLLALFLSLTINAFAFSREGSIRASLDRCGELVDQGWSILIYPEGTRSPTGQLLSFKPGIGYLATGLRVPVVPVIVQGGYSVLPKGAKWPKRNATRVHVGKALYLPPTTDKQAATDGLHECLLELLRQCGAPDS